MNTQQKVAIAIYGSLLGLCVALMIGAEFVGPSVRGSLLPAGVEGFKIVLSALVGALSVILGGKNAGTSVS